MSSWIDSFPSREVRARNEAEYSTKIRSLLPSTEELSRLREEKAEKRRYHNEARSRDREYRQLAKIGSELVPTDSVKFMSQLVCPSCHLSGSNTVSGCVDGSVHVSKVKLFFSSPPYLNQWLSYVRRTQGISAAETERERVEKAAHLYEYVDDRPNPFVGASEFASQVEASRRESRRS